MYRISLILLPFLALVANRLPGQSPKHEFRGVWIASVANIDWPSKPGLTIDEQKGDFLKILDYHKAIGINTVIVQIRPSADALYHSTLEPWSKYLTGKTGQYPYPFYDPLEFMIRSAHDRGIEFHAWFNPYRAVVGYKKNGIDSASVAFQHPEWMLPYGDNIYFDPGLPSCREHVTNVIMDVVNRYDIDGIHFDDYFYPYRIAGEEFPDSVSYAQYGTAFIDRNDWRRDNVDLLIQKINDSLKQVKPFVQFGISPFGIWRNQSVDPRGSATNGGQTCYDDLYADVLKWLEKGWIDYIVPQLYWQIGHRAAPYEVLVEWWNENSKGRPVYIGHGAYRVGNEKDSLWRDDKPILAQLELNRKYKSVRGSVFFSSKSLTNNLANLATHLSNQYYATPALIPIVVASEPNWRTDYKVKFSSRSNGMQLGWVDTLSELGNASRYVIYRFDAGDRIDRSRADKILAILPGTNKGVRGYQFFVDKTASRGRKYIYIITAISLNRVESTPTNAFPVKKGKSVWKTYDPIRLER